MGTTSLIPVAQKRGIGLLPYFPLACGLPAGKYHRNALLPQRGRLANTRRLADRNLTIRNWDMSERVADLANTRRQSLLDLATSWLLAQAPVASAIAGATRPEQLDQNVRALEWHLTAQDLPTIDQPNEFRVLTNQPMGLRRK